MRGLLQKGGIDDDKNAKRNLASTRVKNVLFSKMYTGLHSKVIVTWISRRKKFHARVGLAFKRDKRTILSTVQMSTLEHIVALTLSVKLQYASLVYSRLARVGSATTMAPLKNDRFFIRVCPCNFVLTRTNRILQRAYFPNHRPWSFFVVRGRIFLR